jgi:hypothetical protein
VPAGTVIACRELETPCIAWEGDVQEHDHEHLELLGWCAGCHAELLTTRGNMVVHHIKMVQLAGIGG